MTLVLSPPEILKKLEIEGRLGLLDKHISWERRPLGELCSIQNGAPFESSLFNNMGLGMPLIRIRDISKNITETCYSGTFEDAFVVSSGDLLIGMDGDFRLARWMGAKGLLNQRVCRLVVTSQLVNKTFIELVVPGYLDAIWKETSATTVKHLSSRSIGEIPIPLPPLDEQEKIVEILEEHLSRLDMALASVRDVRKKSARFRRALLKAAITGSLSGHESAKDVLPKGWNLEPLRTCGQWFGGGTPSKSNRKFWEDGTIPWLSPKDMGEFRIRGTQDRITKDAVEESSTKLVPGPSVAMVMRSGILERTFPVSIVDFDTTLNQDMKAIVPNRGVSALWIAYALNAFELELLETCRKSGTTVASMETVRLLNFEIPLPEFAEQLKIIGILEEQISRLDASLAIADAIENKVNALRRSLLHSAFTGELTKEWREGSHV